MQLLAQDGNHLGYYVDIDTPIHISNGEYHLTDLFLDLWIAPDGKYIELDRDEFEEGFRKGLLTSRQYKKANQVFEALKCSIITGDFFRMIH
jgi:predicted RNA-binding protein associated with RNAse of E/G family